MFHTTEMPVENYELEIKRTSITRLKCEMLSTLPGINLLLEIKRTSITRLKLRRRMQQKLYLAYA